MKYFLKSLQLLVFFFLISCFKQSTEIEKKIYTPQTKIEKIHCKKEYTITDNETESYENENDEYISNSLFEKWKGTYKLRKDSNLDSWERESIFFSELNLIKPDSCIFKSWLADENGKRYIKDDNYQEFVGGILATQNKDSIEFYTKRVVSGGNNSLSPLLILTEENKKHFIYSLITSPANNGIIKIPIEKVK